MVIQIKNNKIAFILLISLAMICARMWYNMQDNNKIECHARIHANVSDNQCSIKNVFDVFLSMIGGEGSLSISGSHSCSKLAVQENNTFVKFNYIREGSYYTLHFEPRSEESIKFFNLLENSDNRLKIEPLNQDDYIISSPFETLMMCTKD